MASKERGSNDFPRRPGAEKPIRLPADPGKRGDSDEFKQLLSDLLATGPTPKDAPQDGD